MSDGLTETRLSSELIYDGRVVHLYVDTVQLPNGKTATAKFFVTPLGPGIDPVSANNFKFVLAADGTLKQAGDK